MLMIVKSPGKHYLYQHFNVESKHVHTFFIFLAQENTKNISRMFELMDKYLMELYNIRFEPPNVVGKFLYQREVLQIYTLVFRRVLFLLLPGATKSPPGLGKHFLSFLSPALFDL
jgi:hypothetical protein